VISLVRAEVLKLRTTRVFFGLCAATVAFTVLGVVAGVLSAGSSGNPPLGSAASVRNIFGSGGPAGLFALVLGILAVTGELRHGTITQTFLVAPRRPRVVMAKLVAMIIAGVALGVLAAVVTTAVAWPWLAAKDVSVSLFSSDVAPVMAARPDRPLLIVDIAVPRDIDAGVAELPGVSLLDMDDLKAFAEAGMAGRRREVAGVESIVGEELERYVAASTARQLAPLVVALRQRGDRLRTAELERFRSRLAGLDAGEREAVEDLTAALLAKMLHEPTVRLKEAAGTPRGDRLAEALRALFDLP